MKVLIVEDELLAQTEFIRLLNKLFPEISIAACFTSVIDTVEWLTYNQVDLIFMDIHLSDGLCFDIFKQINIETPIIFVTAYDQYAIKAFKVNSIDYLLKPVDESDLQQAVTKFIHQQKANFSQQQITQLLKIYGNKYKERFTLKHGDQLLFFETKEIAYFYSEYKIVYLVTSAGKKHVMDNVALNALEEVLNPKHFFRLTRNCMTSLQAITSVSKYFNNRLKVTVSPDFDEELLVSRLRVPDFIRWLDGDV